MSPKPLQKILFGSSGTGKSYKIREIAKQELQIKFDDNSKILKNTVKTVFHPEYTYADFMGKLLPLTQGNNVIYKYSLDLECNPFALKCQKIFRLVLRNELLGKYYY